MDSREPDVGGIVGAGRLGKAMARTALSDVGPIHEGPGRPLNRCQVTLVYEIHRRATAQH